MEQRFNLGAMSAAGTAAADTLESSGVYGKMNFSRRRLFYTVVDEAASLVNVPSNSQLRSSSPLSPLSPPPPPPDDNSPNADPSPSGFETLDPNVVIIMVVLLFALICAAFLNSIMRCLLRRAHNRRVAAPAGGAGQGDLSAVQGLDSKILACLPVLTFKPAEKPKEFAADCTICLCEFTENEKLRLLPKCSHVFHLDCIDMWLLCHITCPVCRDGIGDDDQDSSSVGLAVYEEDVRGGMILTRDQDGHPSVTTADGGGGAGGAEMVLIRDPEAQPSGSTRAILGNDETECLRAELLRNRSLSSSTDDSALRLPSREGSSSRRTLRAAFSSIFTADNFFSGRWQASSSSSSSSAPVAPLAIAAAPPSNSASAAATTATSVSSAR